MNMKRIVTVLTVVALAIGFAPQADAANTKVMWTAASGAPISGTPSVAAGQTLYFVLGSFPTTAGLYAYEAVQPASGSRPTQTSAAIPALTMWISKAPGATSDPTKVQAFTIDNGNAWGADCAHQQCGLWFQFDHTNMADKSEDQFVPFTFVAPAATAAPAPSATPSASPTAAPAVLPADTLAVTANGVALVENAVGSITYRTPLTFAVATASKAAVTLKSYTPDLCPVSGFVVEALKGEGTCDIAVTSPGDATHGAKTAHFPLMVSPATQTLSATTATVKVGKIVALTGSTEFGEKITYMTSSKNCSVKGSAVKGLKAGSCVVSASAPGTANYSALKASVVVSVKK
jgi:hypothetical protein